MKKGLETVDMSVNIKGQKRCSADSRMGVS